MERHILIEAFYVRHFILKYVPSSYTIKILPSQEVWQSIH